MSASPGIVVLDRSGRIGFATDGAATLLQLGDGLTARGGQLIGRRGGPRLEDSVQATLADPPDAPCGPLRTVVLCRRDRLPLIATLAPLTSAATGPLGALVLLHDPEAALRPATEVLRQAFGLTVAEAAVAQALVEGAAPRQIAEQRQVSLNTVRTLVARVLGKTGTHRQADLVRLLLPLATAEAVRAGFEAGFRLGAAGGALAGWPVRPTELLRADLALAGRQEARVALSEYAAGAGTAVHQHGDAHEIVYLLGGSLRGEWGAGESREAGAGELLHYGPGLPHRGTNRGAAAARMLVTRIVRLDAAPRPDQAARHTSA
jgi:DNA-binding CsgD family transcriptional regulator/quercetin dioxygenase-like cupin family protein